MRKLILFPFLLAMSAVAFSQTTTVAEIRPGVYQIVDTKAQSDSTDTGKRLLVGNNELIVWRSSRGAYFTSRVSGKTGLPYRAYLPADLVQAMGLTPKPVKP